MSLAQGPQGSEASEARTRDPSVSSQALYHCTPSVVVVMSLLRPTSSEFKFSALDVSGSFCL